MKKFIFSLSMLLLLTANSYAQPAANFKPPFKEIMKIVLKLTPEQETQITEIFKRNKKAIQSKGAELMSAQVVLKSAVFSEPYDENQVRAASKEVAAVQEEIIVHQSKIEAKVSQVLNAEQKALRSSLLEALSTPGESPDAGEDLK
jgi:periplasmic protein CpxP/Spy